MCGIHVMYVTVQAGVRDFASVVPGVVERVLCSRSHQVRLTVCMYVCMYECMYLHLHLCVVITFLRPLLQLWQSDSGEGPAVRGEPT